MAAGRSVFYDLFPAEKAAEMEMRAMQLMQVSPGEPDAETAEKTVEAKAEESVLASLEAAPGFKPAQKMLLEIEGK